MMEIQDIDKNAQYYTKRLYQKVQKQLLSDTENEIIAEIISDMQNFQNFNNGLTDLLIQCGYDGDFEDSVSKANYLYSKIQENNIPTEDFFTKESVRHWFQGKNTPWKDSSHSKMMLICFALHLSVKQTETFFRKVFLGQPFNFRNSTECIFYYCLHNQKSYADAKRLESELQNMRNTTNQQGPSSATRIIRDSLSTFETDDETELLEYLLQNVPAAEVYYQTARKYIEKTAKIAVNCAILAKLSEKKAKLLEKTEQRTEDGVDDNELEKERRKYDKEFRKLCEDYDNARKQILAQPSTELQKNKTYDGINYLMQEIYGFSTESSHKKEKYVFKSELSKTLTRNFPKQHELGRILNGDTSVSSDMMRRTLIILKFYTSYFLADLKQMTPEQFASRFFSDTNVLLNECGFQELYIRHPFDFLFFYCALHAEEAGHIKIGLEVFRDIMEELHENL